MPTYQYVCNDCGQPLEVVQKFSDDALTICPNCEGQLRKVFSAVGIVFKGSGFYRTDNRSSSATSTPTTTPAKPAESTSTPAAAATPAPAASSAASS
ncbi:FmdB family zinc ribbon protein [Nonomuraea dietziae]|uniref:Putative FmdB family regulatory protein n=1 Tax=Nonomuraea dietziae TaxID=65515 RepID=A0A7W5YTB7_9ACTN|nr:FmdB family zinc ribbon protein [Nonomuraea dietziae]MBB3730359.1 putative FmdB family regulatory protein [Nonomuraea dietziae]